MTIQAPCINLVTAMTRSAAPVAVAPAAFTTACSR